MRRRAADADKGWHNFEVQATAAVEITGADGVAAALYAQKPGIALYVGGMGHRSVNFHNQHMRQMGYEAEAERIQELYLAGHKQDAINTVPDEYVDERCLVGPPERIARRYKAWASSGITGLTIRTEQSEVLDLMAGLAREHPAQGMA